MVQILTVGHGTLDRAGFGELLRAVGVAALVDVRRFPGSRRNLDVARDVLPSWLPDEGVSYRWDERLGGRRRIPPGEEPRDTWWRVEAFRAYSAWTRTPEFGEALTELLDDAAARTVVIMCSESVWWRCHRRLIADDFVARGWQVLHLMGPGKAEPHVLNPDAVMMDGVLRYPGPQQSLL